MGCRLRQKTIDLTSSHFINRFEHYIICFLVESLNGVNCLLTLLTKQFRRYAPLNMAMHLIQYIWVVDNKMRINGCCLRKKRKNLERQKIELCATKWSYSRFCPVYSLKSLTHIYMSFAYLLWSSLDWIRLISLYFLFQFIVSISYTLLCIFLAVVEQITQIKFVCDWHALYFLFRSKCVVRTLHIWYRIFRKENMS